MLWLRRGLVFALAAMTAMTAGGCAIDDESIPGLTTVAVIVESAGQRLKEARAAEAAAAAAGQTPATVAPVVLPSPSPVMQYEEDVTTRPAVTTDPTTPPAAEDLAGTWSWPSFIAKHSGGNWKWTPSGEVMEATFVRKGVGYGLDQAFDGTVTFDGKRVVIEAQGLGETGTGWVRWAGDITGDTIVGTFSGLGITPDVPWTATRVK